MRDKITLIHAECYITYKDVKGEESFRQVTFRALEEKPKGSSSVLAYCHLQEDFRRFRVDGIQEIVDLFDCKKYGREEIEDYFRSFRFPSQGTGSAWERGGSSDVWIEDVLNRSAALSFRSFSKRSPKV